MRRSDGYVAPSNNFPEPPLKRVYPWSLDNKYGTDIIAGKVESGSGAFKGLIIKDAQLQTLKRYLQLAATHLPESMPPEAKAMAEGYPTIILTRGVYGRELDITSGPLRNSAQSEIWEVARKARMDHPRMSITCIDVPCSATTAEVCKCFEPPLDQYRELAYYDGTWFTPQAENAANVVRHAKEFPRKTIYQKSPPQSAAGEIFKNRKAFEWHKTDLEDSLWTLVWKAVHTNPAYVPPPVESSRLTVDATKASIAPSRPAAPQKVSVAAVRAAVEAAWNEGGGEKDASRLLDAGCKYIAQQEQSGKAGAEEAKVAAASCARELLSAAGNTHEAAQAFVAFIQAKIAAGDDVASDLAQLRQSAPGASQEAQAIAAVGKALLAAGKVADAVTLTTDASKGHTDKDRSMYIDVQARALLAAGRVDDATKAASSCKPAKGFDLAETFSAIAGVHAANDDVKAALDAQEMARKQYEIDFNAVAQARCLKASALIQLNSGDAVAACETARRIQEVPSNASKAEVLVIAAGLQVDLKEKGGDLTLAIKFAKEALEIVGTEQHVLASAQQVLASALLASGSAVEAKEAAKCSVQHYKEVDMSGKPLAAAMLCSARANVKLGQLHSAMWDAKQALVQSTMGSDVGGQAAAKKVIEQINAMSDTPIRVGRR